MCFHNLRQLVSGNHISKNKCKDVIPTFFKTSWHFSEKEPFRVNKNGSNHPTEIKKTLPYPIKEYFEFFEVPGLGIFVFFWVGKVPGYPEKDPDRTSINPTHLLDAGGGLDGFLGL